MDFDYIEYSKDFEDYYIDFVDDVAGYTVVEEVVADYILKEQVVDYIEPMKKIDDYMADFVVDYIVLVVLEEVVDYIVLEVVVID